MSIASTARSSSFAAVPESVAEARRAVRGAPRTDNAKAPRGAFVARAEQVMKDAAGRVSAELRLGGRGVGDLSVELDGRERRQLVL